MLLHPVYVTEGHVLKVHPGCTRYRSSFLFKPASYSTVGMDPTLRIYSFIHGHLDCFHLLVTVNDATQKTVCKYLFEALLSIILDIYPDVGLLDPILIV